jgi:hypothetical protein
MKVRHLRTVVKLLAIYRVRTSYGVLGAFLAGLGTKEKYDPRDCGPAVGSLLRSVYGRCHPEASWVVSLVRGFPTGYQFPGPDFADDWSLNTRFITSVEELREWLREVLGVSRKKTS